MVLGPYTTRDLRRWVGMLRYFRICGSFGAHFDEPDSLRVALAIPTVAALLGDFASRGAEVVPHGSDQASEHRIARVDGQLVYLSGSGKDVTSIHFIGVEMPGWVPISSAQVKAVAEWEKWIEPLADRLVDPPYFPELCITPQTRPDLFRRA